MQKCAILPLFGDLLTPDDLNFLQNPHKMGLDLKNNVIQTIEVVKHTSVSIFTRMAAN